MTTTVSPTTQPFGSPVKRLEDPKLLTGASRYTSDFNLPGTVHLAVVRSPLAHARILGIDATATEEMPGVLGVFTGQDMADAGFQAIPCAWIVPESGCIAPAHPPIALGKVRYVGDAVAVVIAEDPYQARDGALAVQVDYEELPAVVDSKAAMEGGAPLVHDDVPNNRVFHWTVSGGDIDQAFADADVVVSDVIRNQRLVPNAMEPRAALADWSAASQEVTLWVTSQNPHVHRLLMCAFVLGIPEHKVRVIAPDVGGGFGVKTGPYREEVLLAWLAMRLRRAVRWAGTRREDFETTNQARGSVCDAELALDGDGRLLGLRAHIVSPLGASLMFALCLYGHTQRRIDDLRERYLDETSN